MLKLKKNKQPKTLGMKWFNFFYSVRCLLTMILWLPMTVLIFAEAILNSIYIAPQTAIIVFCSVAMGIYSTITYINYSKNRCFGFYPTSLYYSTINALIFEGVGLLCLLQFPEIIIPAFSIYYFSKRKFMFGLGKSPNYKKTTALSTSSQKSSNKENLSSSAPQDPVKTLTLCKTCKYNEHTFCKYTKCQYCPNYKDNSYCICDEYEENDIEYCPYYVSTKEKINTEAKKEYNYYFRRLSEWAEQEEYDKEFLSQNSPLAQSMLANCEAIILMWEADCMFRSNNIHSFARSKGYVSVLTPELFLKNYYIFKSLDHDAIKDKIYQERPYLVHETFINMGKYIFETNNQIKILEYIAEQDDPEYERYKFLARSIAEIETKHQKT